MSVLDRETWGEPLQWNDAVTMKSYMHMKRSNLFRAWNSSHKNVVDLEQLTVTSFSFLMQNIGLSPERLNFWLKTFDLGELAFVVSRFPRALTHAENLSYARAIDSSYLIKKVPKHERLAWVLLLKSFEHENPSLNQIWAIERASKLGVTFDTMARFYTTSGIRNPSEMLVAVDNGVDPALMDSLVAGV